MIYICVVFNQYLGLKQYLNTNLNYKNTNIMGLFSWITQDTKESISNRYSSRGTFTVSMLDDKGNVWDESYYGGYGIFGGKDYFELLAEMNGKTTREEGIELYYKKDNSSVLYPNLVQNDKYWKWKNEKPKECPHQGHFY